MNMTGTVDYLMASEPMEALRGIEFLRKDSTTIYNKYRLQPMLVSTGQAEYPSEEEVDNALKACSKEVVSFDATKTALEVGNVKTMNIVLLGALSTFIPEVSPDIFEQAIKNHVPAKLQELNIKAFHAGRDGMK